MSTIQILSYPTQVHSSIQNIPIDIHLNDGTPLTLSIDTAQSTTGVSLYTIQPVMPLPPPAVVQYETSTYPGVGNYRVYVKYAGLQQPDTSTVAFPDGSEMKIAVAFAGTGVQGKSDPIYIGIKDESIQTISTEKIFRLSDDFSSGTTLDPDRWRIDLVGATAVTPSIPLNSSTMKIANDPGANAGLKWVRVTGEICDGRAHVEWRNARDTARVADKVFCIGLGFYEANPNDSPGVAPVTSSFPGGEVRIGFGLSTAGPGGALTNPADLSTTIRFNCLGRSVWGTEDVIALPAAGVTTDNHTYGVDFDGHKVELYIDGTLITTRLVSIPNASARWLSVYHWGLNSSAAAGAHDFYVDRVDVRADDRIAISTIGSSGGGPVTVDADMTGLPQSRPAPDTSNVAGTVPEYLQVDPAGNLQVRGQVTTDEGSFADDFPDNAAHTVYTALTGTSLFTAASTAVVGTATAYLSEVRIGDYVVLASEPTFWSQVAAVVDNTHLTLSAAYAGAGGPTAASRVSRHSISTSGGGAVALVSGLSSVALSPAAAGISTAILDRAVGAGGRKGFVPIAVQWYGSIDQRLATEKSVLGLVNDTLGDSAYFYLHGTAATTFECVSSCGFSFASTVLSYASAGTSATDHRYEVKALVDKVEFYVDGTLVATHYGHTPRPYAELTERISISTAPVLLPDKLPVGHFPYGAACDALGQVWVANLGSDSVTVYNIVTRALVGTYATGVGPAGVLADSLGRIWITNSGANTVTVLDAATKAAVAGSPFATGAFPLGICEDSIGQVWIVNTVGDTVTIYDVTTLVPVAGSPKPTGSGPADVADDGMGRVWISNQNDDTVSIYVSATLALDAGSPLAVGDNPRGVSADGLGKMWIVNSGSGNVTVYDAATLAQAAGSPVALAVGSSGESAQPDTSGRVWVSDAAYGLSRIYDATTLAAVTVVSGASPNYYALDSMGQVWASSTADDRVIVYIS